MITLPYPRKIDPLQLQLTNSREDENGCMNYEHVVEYYELEV